MPLIIEPPSLEPLLGTEDLAVVDLAAPTEYAAGHIPGARPLGYADIVMDRPPVLGLLPDAPQVAAVCARLGIGRDTLVVATDDECGGRAARLLWTLAAWGHRRLYFLNGGTAAWTEHGYPVETDGEPAAVLPPAAPMRPVADESVVADREWILANRHRLDLVLLDTRSPGEFDGSIVRAARGGHIPGAVNYEWTQAMDEMHDLRVRPREELLAELAALGVTPDKEVVVYCQSHHRSAHTWVVLKALGFPRVRGYHGAWSDWGNAPDTPITVSPPPRDPPI